MTKMPNEFEQLQMEILIYLNPKLMKEELDFVGVNQQLLERYSLLINVLNQSLKKVKRYETFFADFYPTSSNITHQESLEHHIHAYLADITILRNAINRLLGSLKHDVIRTCSNKEEMTKFFNDCKKETHKKFNQVTELRDAHSHAENRFLDPDLLRSTGLKQLSEAAIVLTDQIKPEDAERYAKDSEESFQRSKKGWCENAKSNNEGIEKIIDALFISMEDPIYKCLGIKPILRDKIKKSKAAADKI